MIDAFLDVRVFGTPPYRGNTTRVFILKNFLSDTEMQSIASKECFPETTFVVPAHPLNRIRWFSPSREVNLCGHGALGAAFALIQKGLSSLQDHMLFQSNHDFLSASTSNNRITLQLPQKGTYAAQMPENLETVLGKKPKEFLMGPCMIAIFSEEEDVKALEPDFEQMKDLCKNNSSRSLAISAPSGHHEYVLRYFTPFENQKEDAATGSIQALLTPYWCEKLSRRSFTVRQLSKDGGLMTTHQGKDTVFVTGEVDFLS